MAIDVRTARTVLPPPSGAGMERDLVYRADGERTLHLDVYRPAGVRAPRPAVFLVSGDAPEDRCLACTRLSHNYRQPMPAGDCGDGYPGIRCKRGLCWNHNRVEVA